MVATRTTSVSFSDLVSEEIAEARSHYEPLTSLHEGYSVLLEEVEELWAEIKKKPAHRSKARLLNEAAQVGAMVQRLADDVILKM